MARTAELNGTLSKKERKEFAREEARLRREAERRRRRRNRVIGWISGTVGAVAALALAAVLAFAYLRAGMVGPLNMLSDGVLLNGNGSAVTAVPTAALQPDQKPVPSTADYTKTLVVDLYVDYGSGAAATFDAANAANLQSWLTAGYASVELHPVAVLNSKDAGYSTRAANALACVADHDPNAVPAVNTALLTAHADAGKDGLDNEELVTLVAKAGVSADTDAVDSCIRNGRFDSWVHDATARAQKKTVSGKGLASAFAVVVDGKPYTGPVKDADAFGSFIDETATAALSAAGASAGSGSGSGSTGSGSTGTDSSGAGSTPAP